MAQELVKSALHQARRSGIGRLRIEHDWDARLDRLKCLTKLLPSQVQVVRLLQIEPQLGAGAEPAAQP